MAKCNECLWFDQCRTSGYCPDFSPVEVDYDAIIEGKREEFEREWAEYTTVMDD